MFGFFLLELLILHFFVVGSMTFKFHWRYFLKKLWKQFFWQFLTAKKMINYILNNLAKQLKTVRKKKSQIFSHIII